MNKWTALAVCAVAAAALGIFAIWALAVREPKNKAEENWASGVCTAIASWQSVMLETVSLSRWSEPVRLRVLARE